MNKLLNCNEILAEMYATRKAIGEHGEKFPMHSHIPLDYAEALYRSVLAKEPKLVVEVGMAFGVSSLAILTALKELGAGRLISIDPHQSQTSGWNGCGSSAVKRAGLAGQHTLIEDFNYRALPSLLSAGTQVDFAYIDGWHTFDHVMLDFWYIDHMLGVDGTVGFNDCHCQAVDRVIRFLKTHRRYTEINVGLKPAVANYTRTNELKRLLHFKTPMEFYRFYQDRYFSKTEIWEPNWDFYEEF